MELIKKESNLLSSFPRFFDDFFSKDLFDWRSRNLSPAGASLPAVNILETREAFQVEMAAPGLKKSDFRVELKDNTLTIRSDRPNEKDNGPDEGWLRREFNFQSFVRTFAFNKELVDDGRIQATYEEGVLRLVLPKRAEAKAKPGRTIQVN